MMRGRSSLLIVLLGLALSGSAHAATPVAFAPLAGLGIDGAEVKKVSRWLRAAATSLSAVRLRGSRKLARALAKRPGCAAEESCLAKVAQRQKLERVVLGHVGSIGGAYVVYLRLLDAKGAITRWVNGLLDPRQRLRASARALLVRLLLPKRYVGKLNVDVNVKGAWVYLDGERVGRGPKVKLDHVAAGTHALRITHDAHRDFVRFVRVDFGRQVSVKARLERIEAQSRDMRLAGMKPLTDAELPWYRRWWAVTTLGVVLVAATTTVVALIPKPTARDRTVTVQP